MARVTGIGGVLFKAQDPEALAAWYAKHLGVPFDAKMGCAIFRWDKDKGPDGGAAAWSLAKADSERFTPSDSSFVLNYTVDDMAALVEQLKAAGIALLRGPDTHDYGVFASIMDPEGNRVELWEPKSKG